MFLDLRRLLLAASLLSYNIGITCDVTAALQSLQSQLKTLRNAIRLPKEVILKEFYRSSFWGSVLQPDRKRAVLTSFSFHFHGKDKEDRNSYIYQVVEETEELRIPDLKKGDIFYIDMAHGNEIEVYDSNLKAKEVLDFDSQTKEEATKHSKGRTLFGRSENRSKIPTKKPFIFSPFIKGKVPGILPSDGWESTALIWRDADKDSNSLFVARKDLKTDQCTLKAQGEKPKELFYTKDGKVYRVIFGPNPATSLINAKAVECT